MLEKILGIDKMSILQCEALAKRIGFDSSTFDLVGPKGRLKARWRDAYLGFFEVEGHDGVMRASDLTFASNLWCENLMPKYGEEEDAEL